MKCLCSGFPIEAELLEDLGRMKEVDIANAVVNDLVSGWKPPSLMPLEKTIVVNRRHLATKPESKWRRLHLVPTRQIALGGRTDFSVVGESSSKLLLRQDATPFVLDSDLRAMGPQDSCSQIFYILAAPQARNRKFPDPSMVLSV